MSCFERAGMYCVVMINKSYRKIVTHEERQRSSIGRGTRVGIFE